MCVRVKINRFDRINSADCVKQNPQVNSFVLIPLAMNECTRFDFVLFDELRWRRISRKEMKNLVTNPFERRCRCQKWWRKEMKNKRWHIKDSQWTELKIWKEIIFLNYVRHRWTDSCRNRRKKFIYGCTTQMIVFLIERQYLPTPVVTLGELFF